MSAEICVRVIFPPGIYPDSGRSVGKNYSRNPEARYRVSCTGGTGHDEFCGTDNSPVAVVDTFHSGADDETGFLTARHGSHNLLNRILP